MIFGINDICYYCLLFNLRGVFATLTKREFYDYAQAVYLILALTTVQFARGCYYMTYYSYATGMEMCRRYARNVP